MLSNREKMCRVLTKLEIIIPPEPLNLRAGIAIYNIAFLILECPGDNDQNIPFPYPDLLFYLPLDPAHPGHPVKAPDPDMVCAHHQIGTPEHLAVSFLGQLYPDDLIAARRRTRFFIGQYNLSFSGLYVLNCWSFRKYS